MHKLLHRGLLAACVLLSSSLVQAETRFMLETGLHAGGDDLVTVTFSDGSTEDIDAGGLISLGAGVSSDLSENLELRFVFNYKIDQVTASNGSIDFSRWVSNLSLMYKIDPWRVGGGLAYHSGIELDGDGVASVISADFDNATGYLLEIDYFWNEHFYLGAQYTDIEYTYTGTSTDVDASSIGVVLGYQF